MSSKKKIIDKKLYDPNTARYLCSFEKTSEAVEEKIYKTKSGNYFVLRDKKITPIDEDTAKKYVKTYIPERYDKIFCDNEKLKKTFLIEPYTVELLEEIKIREGIKKYSTIIDRAVSFYNEHSEHGQLIMPDSIMESVKSLETSLNDMYATFDEGLGKCNELIAEASEKYNELLTEALEKAKLL